MANGLQNKKKNLNKAINCNNISEIGSGFESPSIALLPVDDGGIRVSCISCAIVSYIYLSIYLSIY
jgi:hypothetical protein